MITHREYLLVPIPADMWCSHVEDYEGATGKFQTLTSYPKEGEAWRGDEKKENGIYVIGHKPLLPPGSWQLIGLGSDLTEEQKKEIVHEQNRMCGGKYFDYKKKANVANSSDESFASLLHSHNLNPDTTVILKQIQP